MRSAYDIESGEELDRFAFASPVSLNRFGQDGTRLGVITAESDRIGVRCASADGREDDAPSAPAC